MGTAQHYAYNRTKRSFVSLEVEVTTSPSATLNEWFPRLAPRSGGGMWVVPFSGHLPSTGAPSPLDLVYLNKFGEVVEVVQSFPQTEAPTAASDVASILALPELSVAQSQIEPGDRLLVCAGQELELRLKDEWDQSPLVSEIDELDDSIADTGPKPEKPPVLESAPQPVIAPQRQKDVPPPAVAVSISEAIPLPRASAPVPVEPASVPRISLDAANKPKTTAVPPVQLPTRGQPAAASKIDARPRRISKPVELSQDGVTPRIFEVQPNRTAWMNLPPPIVPGSIKIKSRTPIPQSPAIQFADPKPAVPDIQPPVLPAIDFAAKDFSLDEQISTPSPQSANADALPIAEFVSEPSVALPLNLEPPPVSLDDRTTPAEMSLLAALDQLESRVAAFMAVRGAAPAKPSAATPAQSEAIQIGAYRVIPPEEDLRPFGHYDLPQFAPGFSRGQRPAPPSNGATTASFRADGTVPRPKWWERALDLDPRDPRSATREPLEGLATFFWTGGIPKPHPVRDISLTGLYIVTRERWFPGTEIVMTLTKTTGEGPNPEHSLSLCTRAVRWGHDGVGLQFLLATPMGRSSAHRHMAANVDLHELNRFLTRLKASEDQNSLSIASRDPETDLPMSPAMNQNE